MERLVFLVLLDVEEKRDQRVCRDHQDLLVNPDLWAWPDPQVLPELLVSVVNAETPDHRECLDHRVNVVLLDLLVLKERREQPDPRERRV
jgi:hypothetical protein